MKLTSEPKPGSWRARQLAKGEAREARLREKQERLKAEGDARKEAVRADPEVQAAREAARESVDEAKREARKAGRLFQGAIPLARKCRECGKRIKMGARRCHHCGAQDIAA